MNELYFPLGQLSQLADLASGCARPSGQSWQEIELSEELMYPLGQAYASALAAGQASPAAQDLQAVFLGFSFTHPPGQGKQFTIDTLGAM